MTPRAQHKIEQASRFSQAVMIIGSALALAIAVARGRKPQGRWYAIYPNDKHIEAAPYGR
jgi:hypothetical protein